jgi:putative membrane protein
MMWNFGPYGIHGGWHTMDGMMLFGGGFWLLIVLVVIAIIWMARSQPRTPAPQIRGKSSALEILEERYAKGELERDEFLQKKQDLGG